MNIPTTPKKIGALYAIDKWRFSLTKEEGILRLSVFEIGESGGVTIRVTEEMRSDLLQILQDE